MSAEGAKGCKKKGRNKSWCETYRKRSRREVNMLARAIRTLREQPANHELRQLVKSMRHTGHELAYRDAARLYLSRCGGTKEAHTHVTDVDTKTA